MSTREEVIHKKEKEKNTGSETSDKNEAFSDKLKTTVLREYKYARQLGKVRKKDGIIKGANEEA